MRPPTTARRLRTNATTGSIREAAMVMTSPTATIARMKGRPGVSTRAATPSGTKARARSAGVLAAGGKWWL